MKIAIDKTTNKIVGFANVDGADLSYLKNCNIKTITGKMPDRVEACKWDGTKIIVDPALKVEAEKIDKRQKIIVQKKIEILAELEAERIKEQERKEAEFEQQALQRAIDEGLLSTDKIKA